MGVFSHVLIPLDGSRQAEVVLPVALELARGVEAKVTLLHVLERGAPHTIHGEPHLHDASLAERYLAEVAAQHSLPGHVLDSHVHLNQKNDVATSIVGHAQELGADLTALTTHGRRDLHRLLVGSIVQLVLQRGTTPVLLVPAFTPAGTPAFQFQHLLVPLYEHDAINVIVPTAAELARTFDMSVDIVQVVPTLATVHGDRSATALLTPIATASTLELEAAAAHLVIDRVTEAWAGNRRPTAAILRGDPTQVLVERIERTHPDLTIMATHGRAGLPGLWAGSVTSRILHRTSRPLLLVRVATPVHD